MEIDEEMIKASKQKSNSSRLIRFSLFGLQVQQGLVMAREEAVKNHGENGY